MSPSRINELTPHSSIFINTSYISMFIFFIFKLMSSLINFIFYFTNFIFNFIFIFLLLFKFKLLLLKFKFPKHMLSILYSYIHIFHSYDFLNLLQSAIIIVFLYSIGIEYDSLVFTYFLLIGFSMLCYIHSKWVVVLRSVLSEGKHI